MNKKEKEILFKTYHKYEIMVEFEKNNDEFIKGKYFLISEILQEFKLLDDYEEWEDKRVWGD